jgi:hypothetical protein
MTDKLRTERDVDAAIDRAVLEIMSAEPRPGFRRRVLERLTDAPPAGWTWARVTVGIGAAAATLVAAIWLSAPERSTAPTAPVVARQQAAEVAPPPPSPTPKTEGQQPVVKKPVAPAGPLATVPRTRVPQPPPGRVEAASLPLPQPNAVSTIEPIQLPPLQPIPEVDIRRIIIERITIAPLSPPR